MDLQRENKNDRGVRIKPAVKQTVDIARNVSVPWLWKQSSANTLMCEIHTSRST